MYLAILNTNIVNKIIIHVVIDFSENHIKSYGWILRKNGFIMNFWNNDTTFVKGKMKNINSNSMSY
jgi:hypothetical protein